MSKIKNNNNAPEGLSLRRDVHAFIQQERNEPVTVTETVKLSTSIANSQAAHYDVVYARTTRASELTKNDDPKSLFDFRNYGPEAIIPQNAAASVLSLNLKLNQNKQISVNSTLKVDKSVVIQEALKLTLSQEQTINVNTANSTIKKFLKLCYFDAVVSRFPPDNAANRRFFYTGISENQHPPGNILFAEARIKFPEKFIVTNIDNVYPIGMQTSTLNSQSNNANVSTPSILFDRYTFNPVNTVPFSLNNNQHNTGRKIKPLVHIHYYPLIGFSYYHDGQKFVLDEVFTDVSPFIDESFKVEAVFNAQAFARYANINTNQTTALLNRNSVSDVIAAINTARPVPAFPVIKTNLASVNNVFNQSAVARFRTDAPFAIFPTDRAIGNSPTPRYTLPKFSNTSYNLTTGVLPNLNTATNFQTYSTNRIFDNIKIFQNGIRKNGLMQNLQLYKVTQTIKHSLWCNLNTQSEDTLRLIFESNNINLPYKKLINKSNNSTIILELSSAYFKKSNYNYVQSTINTNTTWAEHAVAGSRFGFEFKENNPVVELNIITFTQKENNEEIPRIEELCLEELKITSSLTKVINNTEYSILEFIDDLQENLLPNANNISKHFIRRITDYFNGGELLLGLKLSLTTDNTTTLSSSGVLNFYLYSDHYVTNTFGSSFSLEDQEADITGRGARVRNYNHLLFSSAPIFNYEGFSSSSVENYSIVSNNYFFQNDRRQSFKFTYNVEYTIDNETRSILVSNVGKVPFVTSINTTANQIIGGETNVLPGLFGTASTFNSTQIEKTMDFIRSFKITSNLFQSTSYISGVDTANMVKNTTLTTFTFPQEISTDGKTPVNNEIGFMLYRISQRLAGNDRKQQIETLEIHDILP